MKLKNNPPTKESCAHMIKLKNILLNLANETYPKINTPDMLQGSRVSYVHVHRQHKLTLFTSSFERRFVVTAH